MVLDAIFDVVLRMFSKSFVDCDLSLFPIFFMQQLAQLDPRHMRTRWNIEEARRCFGQCDDVGFCIPGPVAESRSSEREFQTCGSFIKCLTCLSLFGDVACNLGGADNCS